jgi:hypothetical protein
MSFTFTVSKIDNLLEPGIYIGSIRHAEHKRGDFGSYVLIEWEIEQPETNSGYIVTEKFNTGSDNPDYREKAHKKFSRFCNQVLNLQPGDTIEDLFSLVNKKCKLSINKWTNEKGNTYQTVTHREPYSSYQLPIETGIQAPENVSYGKVNIPTNVDLNDDLPF